MFQDSAIEFQLGSRRRTLKVRRNSKRQAQQLAEAHRSFASVLAKRFCSERPGIANLHEDLQAAAYVGLCEAAQRYKANKGSAFKTYSYTRIRGAMWDLLRQEGEFIRERSKKNVTTTDECQTNLMSQESPLFGADPNGILPYRLVTTGEEQPLDLVYSETQDPEEQCIFRACLRRAEQCLRTLPPLERSVIKQIYLQERRLEDVKLGRRRVSKSTLSRAHRRGLQQLKELFHSGTVG